MTIALGLKTIPKITWLAGTSSVEMTIALGLKTIPKITWLAGTSSVEMTIALGLKTIPKITWLAGTSSVEMTIALGLKTIPKITWLAGTSSVEMTIALGLEKKDYSQHFTVALKVSLFGQLFFFQILSFRLRAENFLLNSLVHSDKSNVYFICPNHKTTCPKNPT